MALTPSKANIIPAGIQEWAIHDTARPDTGYAVIPFPRNGKVEFLPLKTENSSKQPLQYAYDMKISCEFMATRTTAYFIKLLDSLGSKLIDHRITMIGGQVFSSKPTSGTLSPTGFGIDWEVISDKDFDDVFFVRITASRKITYADYIVIITSANKDATAANANDTFYGLGSLSQGTDICPAGIASFACGATGAYGDSITNLRNGKFTAKLLTTRPYNPVGYGIDIAWDIESMETTEAELLKWNAILQRANYIGLTFHNGIVCSLALTSGLTMGHTSDKDFDDIQYLKVSGGGRILFSQWDGIWSA
jgi:hypothetical protein